MSSSITIVPFYDSLGAEATSFILNQTELQTLCIESKFLDMIVKIKKSKPSLALMNIVSFDKVTEEMTQKAKAADLRLYYLHDVMQEGRNHREEIAG